MRIIIRGRKTVHQGTGRPLSIMDYHDCMNTLCGLGSHHNVDTWVKEHGQMTDRVTCKNCLRVMESMSINKMTQHQVIYNLEAEGVNMKHKFWVSRDTWAIRLMDGGRKINVEDSVYIWLDEATEATKPINSSNFDGEFQWHAAPNADRYGCIEVCCAQFKTLFGIEVDPAEPKIVNFEIYEEES